MSKPRRNKPRPPFDDVVFGIKPRKAVPFSFVLDAIAPLSPWTRPMFGCLAIYVQDKIVLILRDKQSTPLARQWRLARHHGRTSPKPAAGVSQHAIHPGIE